MFINLSWAILVSGLLTIVAGRGGRHKLYYLLKPLTTVLIGVLAVVLLPDGSMRNWMFAALVFCLLGDIALMWEGDLPFALGLGAFLLGHVLFIAVFLKGQSDALSTWVLPAWWPVLALHAIVMLVWLLPRTGKLAPAVLVYVLAIFLMALAAGGLSPTVGLHGKPLVLLGALLFVLSDTILAIDRFVKPLAAGHGLVLLTYYCALWCIVVGSSG